MPGASNNTNAAQVANTAMGANNHHDNVTVPPNSSSLRSATPEAFWISDLLSRIDSAVSAS